MRAAVADLARVTAENATLRAERDKFRAERDRLIEAWPNLGNCYFRCVGKSGRHHWYTRPLGPIRKFRDRTEAVRFAAGLDPEPTI